MLRRGKVFRLKIFTDPPVGHRSWASGLSQKVDAPSDRTEKTTSLLCVLNSSMVVPGCAIGALGLHHISTRTGRRFASTGSAGENLPLDADTTNRWLEAVVRVMRSMLQGAAPYVPDNPPYDFDPRRAARMAFDACVTRYEGHVDQTVRTAIKQPRNPNALERDALRVPIACNAGRPGTGKTIQLGLLCQEFVSSDEQGGLLPKKRIAVYFTLAGDSSGDQPYDQHDLLRDRLARRILYGLVSDRMSLPIFIAQLVAVGHQQSGVLGHMRFQEWLSESIPQIIRGVYNADDSIPILIAADELRKWGHPPGVGETSSVAVAILQRLARVSQAAASRKARALIEGAHRIPGSVFVAASALAVIDWSKGVAMESSRPVFYMPLPPLNACMYDAMLTKATAGKDPRIFPVLRAAVFDARENAREMASWASNACEVNSTDAAIAFREKIATHRTTVATDGLSKLLRVNPPLTSRDFRKLLTSVFHRTNYDRFSTQIADRLHPALLCDSALGLATILRDDVADTVYMSPQAIHQVLVIHGSDAGGLALEETALLQGLCNSMIKLLAASSTDSTTGAAGKLYEEIITRAFVMRANTLPLFGMSLYEFIKGVPPPHGEQSFFTTTQVHSWRKPLKEAPLFVFPRAARLCDSEHERSSFEREMQLKFNNQLHFTAKYSPQGIWSNCEFQHPPPARQPFYTIFAHDYNVMLDGCLLLNVTFGENPTRQNLLLGLQMKEHAVHNMTQMNDFAAVHEKKLVKLAACDRGNRGMAAWLAAREISEVVTVYVGPNALSKVPLTVLPCASTLVTKQPKIYDRFKHRCYIHHEDIRQWCPSVAYSSCDARVLASGPVGSTTSSRFSSTAELSTASGPSWFRRC